MQMQPDNILPTLQVLFPWRGRVWSLRRIEHNACRP